MDISLIQKLQNHLNEHLERYQELIDFLDKEKLYLLNLDLDGLLVVSKAKENLARSILASGNEIKETLLEVALMLGFDQEKIPTLSELGTKLPNPYRNAIIDGANHLALLKNRIVRENAQAQAFVEQSLNLVNESLNILSGANQIKADGYQSDGKKDKSVKKALPSKLSRDI
jgi:hypothetical protein